MTGNSGFSSFSGAAAVTTPVIKAGNAVPSPLTCPPPPTSTPSPLMLFLRRRFLRPVALSFLFQSRRIHSLLSLYPAESDGLVPLFSESSCSPVLPVFFRMFLYQFVQFFFLTWSLKKCPPSYFFLLVFFFKVSLSVAFFS